MNEKNQADKEIMPSADTFPNSNVEKNKFLSENEIKKEVEHDSDLEIPSIDNSGIKEEIEEVYIKEEYSADTNEDELEYSNPFADTEDDDVKWENENNPACFVTLSIGDDEIKTEIEEADMKKKCFGEIYENILEYSKQSPNIKVGEEFDIAIELKPENERLSKESFSTVTTKKKLLRSNEFNVFEDRNSEPENREVDESASTSKYECDSCKKRFTSILHLTLHDCIQENLKSDISETDLLQRKDLHIKMRPNTCGASNKSYVKNVHSKEKLHICPICTKSFAKKSHLVDHERLHTGEKPYSCQVCKKSFAHKSTLVDHERLHTGEKPFTCQLCYKSFTQKSNFVRHERIHTGETPYSCDMCDNSFTFKSQLVIHKRLHTGEKPYSCQVCEKSFTTRSQLVKHERIHTGENS